MTVLQRPCKTHTTKDKTKGLTCSLKMLSNVDHLVAVMQTHNHCFTSQSNLRPISTAFLFNFLADRGSSCSSPWILNPYSGTCLLISGYDSNMERIDRTWSLARDKCGNYGADLATFHCPQSMLWFIKYRVDLSDSGEGNDLPLNYINPTASFYEEL